MENDEITKNIKLLRMTTVCQIMYYVKFNGPRKAPLPILIGLQIWSRTKSKTLTTIFNHFGLSICYDENLRIRTALAEYAKLCSEHGEILPSHFDPQSFITAAMDNLDFKDS